MKAKLSLRGYIVSFFLFVSTSLYRARKYIMLGLFAFFLFSMRQRLNRLEQNVQVMQQKAESVSSAFTRI